LPPSQTTKLTALVTSAGTFLLGLSWLIGTTAQEVLGATIFIFAKHPFDVGDRVDIDGNSYVVQEMFLMSTVFRRVDGKYVFLPNNILNTKLIENVRRSGPTSESFSFDVSFDTNFEQIQALRERMLKFLAANKRDYLGTFDVNVVDFPEQSKMTLKVCPRQCALRPLQARLLLIRPCHSHPRPISPTKPTGSRARSRSSATTSGSAR
jgi:small-conductance mechanosensitive channel